jgi:multiple sugar transport system permease protein
MAELSTTYPAANVPDTLRVMRPVRGLSDRTIAWLFVGPVVALLLAINIFPLLWNIYLSFTNYRANQPGRAVDWFGLRNYERLLTSEDVWGYMQVTAHFVFWTMFFEMLLGFGLAWLINRQFRGHATWTTIITLPMMLSPAVVGTFWAYLFEPQAGIFNYMVNFFIGAGAFTMIGDVALAPWAIVLVDTWMWTPFVMLICLAGLRSIPQSIYEAAEVDGASSWRQFWTITIPLCMPFILLALLFRGIENFKMFDMVVELTSGGPGSITELASINLKRQAFESWRTGYSAAFAVILFVTVFGAANVLVRVLNRVRDR